MTVLTLFYAANFCFLPRRLVSNLREDTDLLAGAQLAEANLPGVDFGDADLSGACFARANLSKAFLNAATLTRPT
jgi:uncharacterized protein YjbI with pentapeptide repeats